MYSVFGRGAFSVPLAARLLRLSLPIANAPAVRRWAFGYERDEVRYQPAISTDAQRRKMGGVQALTFLELTELMHIAAFLEAGRSWKQVREAIQVARALLPGEVHPFANRRWFSDAKRLYMEMGKEHGQASLIEMAGSGQVVFQDTLKSYLRQIEFSKASGVPERWYPMEEVGKLVVVDPERSYGMPIVSNGGVRTDVLFEHTRAGEGVSQIASAYDVTDAEVEAAIEFETRLAA